MIFAVFMYDSSYNPAMKLQFFYSIYLLFFTLIKLSMQMV